MTSHRDCTHPPTKAARARCRKLKADLDALQAEHDENNRIYHETYIVPFEQKEAARLEWEAMKDRFAYQFVNSADQNAFDTAHEEGFEPYSQRWYECAISTLESARDDAPRNIDLNDPDEGQSIDWLGRELHWIDRVISPASGWEITIIDREGNRKVWMINDLKKYKAQWDAYGQYVSDGIGDTDGYYAPISFEAFCATLGKNITHTDYVKD